MMRKVVQAISPRSPYKISWSASMVRSMARLVCQTLQTVSLEQIADGLHSRLQLIRCMAPALGSANWDLLIADSLQSCAESMGFCVLQIACILGCSSVSHGTQPRQQVECKSANILLLAGQRNWDAQLVCRVWSKRRVLSCAVRGLVHMADSTPNRSHFAYPYAPGSMLQ
eukprot:1158543-Pelagomonas_calceolata.AAC.1